MKFIFQGPPIAKNRPRVGKSIGKNTRGAEKSRTVVYSNQKMEEAFCKMELKSQILEQSTEKRTEMANTDAFNVMLIFYLPLPKKLNKAQIKAIQEGNGIEYANTKPDLDNLIKFYLDVANGILYKDDKQIVCIQAMKMYDLNPRTEFIITPH